MRVRKARAFRTCAAGPWKSGERYSNARNVAAMPSVLVTLPGRLSSEPSGGDARGAWGLALGAGEPAGRLAKLTESLPCGDHGDTQPDAASGQARVSERTQRASGVCSPSAMASL